MSDLLGLLGETGLVAFAVLGEQHLVHVSPRFLALFGLAGDCSAADRDDLHRRLERARREAVEDESGFHFRCTVRLFDRSTRELDLHGQDGELGGVPVTMLVAYDVTAHRRELARLNFLALHDPLTGLSNRTLMRDRLEQAVAGAARYGHGCAVLLVDLDGFKAVNDRFGHATGDVVLKDVAARLQHCARESDTVARPGGDEFVVIMAKAACHQDAGLFASRVVQSLAREYRFDDACCRVGASVGVAVYPQDGRDADALMAHADAAMYFAKGSGKNRYAFPQATRESLLALQTLEWREERDTGFDEVDEQHRELVEHMNALAAAVREGADCGRLAVHLEAMMRFLRRHFAAEERLMLREPGAWDDEHRAEHRRLLEDVGRLTMVVDEQGVALAVRFLYEWLFRHVDAFDRKLGSG